MIPILFSANETDFNTNGLGRLADCISCIVTEERNGQYTMEMVYPIDGLHFGDISYSSIIRAVPSDGATEQLFRVYKISKPLNGKVKIDAEHISYHLSYIPVSPFSAGSCSEALAGLKSHSMEDNPFTVWTDKTTNATYTQDLPASFRSRLGGVRGSILDVYGGEYEFDNYTVKLYASRGSDRGVTLRYGKNITDINQEKNIANTVTGICPYWTDGTNTTTGAIQYTDTADSFPYKRTVIKDFSEDFKDQPTQEELEQHTRDYIENNDIGIPNISIDVSFVALWQTDEYADIANLERVNLCDTITVEFEKLGISAKAKVIKTEYDVLKERYNRIEVGESRTNLISTLSEMQKASKESASDSFMRQAINHANTLLSGGLGGHVVINRNANGEPNEILIMDTDSKDTAVNVIRMNVNGIGFSTSGYDGDYTTAWTIDGKFNADFIQAGTINAIDIIGSYIKGATLEFGDSTLTATMGYQPAKGYGGEDALTITGNTRVSIESSYQCRMTGASTHVGAIAVENDEFVDKAYLAIFKNSDSYTAWTKSDNILNTVADGISSTADTVKTTADTQITNYVYNSSGYANGLDIKSDYARLTAATSDGYIRGVTARASGTTVSGPLIVTDSDNCKGVVGSVTDGMKLQYYGGRIYVYVNGSSVGNILLE